MAFVEQNGVIRLKNISELMIDDFLFMYAFDPGGSPSQNSFFSFHPLKMSTGGIKLPPTSQQAF